MAAIAAAAGAAVVLLRTPQLLQSPEPSEAVSVASAPAEPPEPPAPAPAAAPSVSAAASAVGSAAQVRDSAERRLRKSTDDSESAWWREVIGALAVQ